jgi:hypothetical protein
MCLFGPAATCWAFFNAFTRKRASKLGTGLSRERLPDLSRATREVGPTLGRVLGADRARSLFLQEKGRLGTAKAARR